MVLRKERELIGLIGLLVYDSVLDHLLVVLLQSLPKSPGDERVAQVQMVSHKWNVTHVVSRVEYESVVFSTMQVTIAERKGYSLARQRQFAEAYLALESIGDLDRSGIENLSARITKAKMLLLEVHQLLASDPLLCVLSESGNCP